LYCTKREKSPKKIFKKKNIRNNVLGKMNIGKNEYWEQRIFGKIINENNEYLDNDYGKQKISRKGIFNITTYKCIEKSYD
jgi:hypothetical protein